MSFFEILSKISLSRGAHDDDAVDQLHHFGTVTMFAAFAALVGMNQYVGDPIHCWVPAQFPDHHQAYAENVCWISRMYYVPQDEEIPHVKEDRMQRDISFYRWVMVIFIVQCFLFKFPNLLWKELQRYSGLNVQKIVKMVEEVTLSPPEMREQIILDISHFLHKWLHSYRVYEYTVMVRVKEKMSSVFCFMLGKRQGTYLTGLYLFIKLLNLINVLAQFFMLTAFLKFNYWIYGFQVLEHVGGWWVDIDHFPRVVMCDFEIRQLQNVQTYSLQCVLSINLFIEKIFAVAWFWLFILAVASFINFTMWSYDIFFSVSEILIPVMFNHLFKCYKHQTCNRREQFIQKYLGILINKDSKLEVTLFRKFVHTYLRDDGVFLLRSVGNNSSEIILMDLIKELWENFKKDNPQRLDKRKNSAASKT